MKLNHTKVIIQPQCLLSDTKKISYLFPSAKHKLYHLYTQWLENHPMDATLQYVSGTTVGQLVELTCVLSGSKEPGNGRSLLNTHMAEHAAVQKSVKWRQILHYFKELHYYAIILWWNFNGTYVNFIWMVEVLWPISTTGLGFRFGLGLGFQTLWLPSIMQNMFPLTQTQIWIPFPNVYCTHF